MYNTILNKYITRNKEFCEMLNDIINDMKYQSGPGEKMNIIFRATQGNILNFRFNYGITHDQILQIYLRRIGRRDLIGSKRIL